MPYLLTVQRHQADSLKVLEKRIKELTVKETAKEEAETSAPILVQDLRSR